MKLNLANATRVFLGWAVLATLPLPAPLHGAGAGFPLAENFQSQLLLNSTDTTARWTSSGVTLGRARGVHETVFTMQDRPVGAVGNAEIFDIALQDINGDGRLDIVTAGPNGVVVYFNDPASGFSLASSTVVTTTSSHLLTFGDYDRDGDLDIIAGSWLRRSNVILHKNDGRGGFDSAAIDSSVPDLVANGLATADIDGDGHLDLAIALQGREGGVDLYRNDGNGGFRHQDTVDSGGPHRDIQMGDLNGDGRPDIVLVKDGVGGFHLNSFNPERPDVWRFESMTSFSSRTGTRLVLGDVNNDSHLDIVVSVRSARNSVHLNNGSGVFGSAFISPNRTSLDVALGDIDGDGDLDVVEGNIRHRRGFSFIYTNDGSGNFDTNGSRILLARSRAVALGDVDNDGDLDIVFGNQNAALRVKVNPGITAADAPSDSLFDTGHGRVVSGKVNGDAQVPHIVFLTATEVQQAHTEIEYYLSSDGGRHWVRGYPGESVRFLARGNDLRWRAELKSRSSTLTPTLTRVGIENVLQVSIDGDVFRGNEIYTATSQTTQKASTPVTIRLLNRGDRALTITGIETIREAFVLQDRAGETLPQPLSIEIEGKSHADFRLVFEPERRGTTDSVLTIFGSEGGRVLPEVKVGLRGQGLAPKIDIPNIGINPIDVRIGTSGSRTVEIENNGEEPLRISTPAIANPEFSLVNPADFPVPVTAGNSVEIKFWFEPENRGTTTTDITFFSNADNGTQTITLEAKGVAPVIEIPPPALVSVREGGRTTGEIVIRNTGDSDMAITAVTGTDEFFDLVSPTTASINGFGLMVPRESSETVVFSFRPAPGERSASTANIIFTSDAFNDTQTEVILKGRGTAPEIAVAPADSVRFDDVRVGSSTDREVVITNMGDAPLMVSGVETDISTSVLSLIEPMEFPQPVSAGETLSLKLRFEPEGLDNINGTLSIDSDAVNEDFEPPTISGEGVAPEITVRINDKVVSKHGFMSHHFGDVDVNQSTDVKVDIDNRGGGALLEVESPEDSSPDLDANRHFHMTENVVFPIMLEPGDVSSSSLTLFFEPKTHGTQTTTLTFVSDSFGSTRTDITLTGVGLGAEMELRVGGERLAHNTTHTVGDIRVDRSTEVRVEVHNIGNVPMSMVAPLPEHQESDIGFMPDTANPPRTVNGGSSATFVFRLSPDKPGNAITRVTFVSGAVIGGRQTITLKGRAFGPVISTEPGADTGVQFGEVRVGKSTDREVLISNKGDAPLMVTSAMVTNREGETALSVVEPERFPQMVSVGATLTVTLRFTPEASGRMASTLTIVSDTVKRRDRPLHLDISGEGVVPEMVVAITGTDIDSVPADSVLVSSHDFGEVPINASTSRRVIISNQLGKASLEVFPELSGGRGFRWESTPSGAIVVQAGESTSSLVVHFEPEERRLHGTDLIFRDTLNDIHTTVTLTGLGLSSEMELRVGGQRLAPNMEHPIGDIEVDKSSAVDVVVHNLGNLPMTVSPSMVTNVGEIEGFVLVDAGGLTATVGGGSSETFTFRFSPRERGDAATIVTFSSDADDNTSQTITLTGRGTGAEMQLRVDGEILAPNTTHTVSGIRVDRSTEVRVEVRNIGNVSMKVNELMKEDRTEEGFMPLGNHGQPRVVTENQSVIFIYQFIPNKRGTATTLVTFKSDAVSSGEQTIILHSKGVGPVISTVPGAILGVRFDDVRVGKSTDEEVLITNKGDFPLMITSLVVTNTGVKEVSESVITVVNPPEFPKELSVGTTLSLTLRFTPEDRDGVGGLLLIGSDTVGGAGPPPIFGQGLAAEISIEVTATDAVVAHDGSNRLMLETVSYDFGNVPVGTSASAKVSIANEHGNTPLRVGIEEINNPHFRWENYPEGGVVDLDARTSSSLILTFEPKSHGVKTAGFVVESDAHNATRTDVTLTGRGVGPAMQVEIADTARRPDAEFMVRQFGREFHFGEWQVSSTASVKVRISNRGNAPLDLDMTKPVEVETTEADFQFLDRNPTPTRKLRPTVGDRHTPPYLVGESAPTIAAGSSSTFMLHFKPSVPSRKDNGRLVINSNDPGHPEWKLNLEGSGRGALMRITLVTSDAAYIHPTQTHVHDVGEIRVNHRLAWDDLFVRLQNLGNENLKVSLEMAEGSVKVDELPAAIVGALSPTR